MVRRPDRGGSATGVGHRCGGVAAPPGLGQRDGFAGFYLAGELGQLGRREPHSEWGQGLRQKLFHYRGGSSLVCAGQAA